MLGNLLGAVGIAISFALAAISAKWSGGHEGAARLLWAAAVLFFVFGLGVMIWPKLLPQMRAYRMRWPIERRERANRLLAPIGAGSPSDAQPKSITLPPYVGRIYVDFQHISEYHKMTINLTCKNMERAPIKISSVDGYIIYEGDARAPQKPQELPRPSLANPFEAEWWPARAELYIQVDQALPTKLVKTLKESFDLGTPLKFRLAFLNIWFMSEASRSRVRLPVWNALQCTKVGGRTDTVELNEVSASIGTGP